MEKDFYMLIIEDEEILAKQTKEMIEENCKFVNRIKIASTGEEGLEEIIKEKPDYIILNQYMPGITGLEMLERCHSQNLKLPEIIVITGGLKTDEEVKRFYELGVKYISSRLLNEVQKRFIFYHIEQAYKNSIKIPEEDMTRLISNQMNHIIEDIRNIKQPYNVVLLGYLLRHLLINDIEYTKEIKDYIYKELQEKNGLTENMINEIREKIEEVIEKSYIKGDPIRKLNYSINKEKIQEEFFHKLKENVLNDIIAESN